MRARRSSPAPFAPAKLRSARDVAALQALLGRIARRIDDMLEQGWADEVQRLMQTVPPDAPAWNSTGYDAVRRLLRGVLTRSAFHEQVLIDTRQYAKRQRTWFRHQLPDGVTTRVDPTSAECAAIVAMWSRGS